MLTRRLLATLVLVVLAIVLIGAGAVIVQTGAETLHPLAHAAFVSALPGASTQAPGFPKAGSPPPLPRGRLWLLLVPLAMIMLAAATLRYWRSD